MAFSSHVQNLQSVYALLRSSKLLAVGTRLTLISYQAYEFGPVCCSCCHGDIIGICTVSYLRSKFISVANPEFSFYARAKFGQLCQNDLNSRCSKCSSPQKQTVLHWMVQQKEKTPVLVNKLSHIQRKPFPGIRRQSILATALSHSVLASLLAPFLFLVISFDIF